MNVPGLQKIVSHWVVTLYAKSKMKQHVLQKDSLKARRRASIQIIKSLCVSQQNLHLV